MSDHLLFSRTALLFLRVLMSRRSPDIEGTNYDTITGFAGMMKSEIPELR